MKRMLINATQEEELRVAMVDGQKLFDLDIEVPSRAQKKANIYKGKITRIEPSLDAAFVDYGVRSPRFPVPKGNLAGVLRQGARIRLAHQHQGSGSQGRPGHRRPGRQRKSAETRVPHSPLSSASPAALSCLCPTTRGPAASPGELPVTSGMNSGMRSVTSKIPAGMGVIVRTAGMGRSKRRTRTGISITCSESGNPSRQAVVSVNPRRHLFFRTTTRPFAPSGTICRSELGEILIDDEKTLRGGARVHGTRDAPESREKLKFYNDDSSPLFTRFQIESQIESAFAHTVHGFHRVAVSSSTIPKRWSPSISIPARSTKGGDIEATAFATNLEAADEVARQCRLRDLGGLLVIDFIDMGPATQST